MRILLTGGGTGGHIYPALAIAAELRRLRADAAFLYAGGAGRLEADLVPRAGIDFAPVRSGALVGTSPLAFLRGLVRMAAGLGDALGVLRRFRPHLVLATGGFVCGPVLAAATLLRVPYVLWEGNAYPGATVRLFARWARGTFIPYPEGRRFFPSGVRLEALGNPVRPDVLAADRAAARRQWGLDAGERLVLAFGGSQGARGIHQALVAAAPQLLAESGVYLLHVTGPAQYDDVASRYRSVGIEPTDHHRLWLRPYLYDMAPALAAADLAITRAGANSLAELAARGLPAVIVPFPHSTHGHQESNAHALAERGAARMVLESELTGPGLAGSVLELLQSPALLAGMAAAMRSAMDPNAGARIARRMLDWARPVD